MAERGRLHGALSVLGHRVGHRGASLLFFAQLDLIYGALLMCARPAPGSVLAYLAAHWPPLPVWGAAWLTVGVVCAVFAFRRQDTPAFVAAMAIKFGWASAHFWTWAETGNVWALAGTIIWITAIGWVANAATWAEPVTSMTPNQLEQVIRSSMSADDRLALAVRLGG